MFQANENGFFLSFANGYQISVKWDSPYRGGFYCNMNDEGVCVAAEVAIFDPKGSFVKLGESDDVIGRQTPDDVLALMTKWAAA